MLQLLHIYIHTCSKYRIKSHCNLEYLKPVYVSEGKVSLILFTAHLVVLLLLVSLANSSTIVSVDDSLCIGTAYS